MMRYVILLLLLPLVAFGQTITGVSGTVADGEAVTISGSSFGTKTPAAPVVFAEFNDGAAESEIDSMYASHGWESYGAGATDPARYAIGQNRDGTTHVRFITPDRNTGTELQDCIRKAGLNISVGDKVYYSIWARNTFDGAQVYSQSPASPQQWKGWRFGSTSTFTYPVYAMEYNGALPAPPGSPRMFWKYEGGGGNSGYRIMEVGEGVPDTSSWWNWESEIYTASSRGAGDGSDHVMIRQEDNPGSYTYWEDIQTGINFVDADDPISPMWVAFNLDSYTQTIPDGRVYTYRFDDIVIDSGDYAWARVMLGNASTYTASDHVEYQPASSWSAASIVVTVNVGSFAVDDPAYLFVIDSDGNVSSGYPVIIGDSGGGGGGPGTPDIQTATRSGGNASLTWLSGDGGPYTVWLQSDDVRGIVTADTTISIPMSAAATDVTVKDGTSQRRAHIAE